MTLLLDVLHHHFIGHITRAGGKVASCLKMPPPKLTTQRLELHQHPPRRPPLDLLEQFTDGYMRRYRDKNVHMIPGNMPLENLYVSGLANFPYPIP
jgi:hypothetical protein